MKNFILLIFLLTQNFANASTHKCEINGKIVFRDAPCTGEIESTGEIETSSTNEPTQRELFDKVFIGQLKVRKEKENGEFTPTNFEVTATNNTKTRVQLTLKYDGLDDQGLAIDTLILFGMMENNTNKIIKTKTFKKTALLKRIVSWRFNSWKSAIN
jgi:hypothetical protein